jgi:hypothetical protein
MNMHPLSRFSPSRIGGEATQLLRRTVTLASVVVDRLAADVDGDLDGDVDGDVDGEQPTEIVLLSYRGVDYEIDLTEKAASRLDEALRPYLADARRVTGKRRSTGRPAVASSVAQNPSEVRAWARTHGIVIADRGRVSADVMRQYREAHHG